MERSGVKSASLCAVFFSALLTLAGATATNVVVPATVVVVVGAPGEDRYGEDFRGTASNWVHAAEIADASCKVIGLDQPAQTNEMEQLRAVLRGEARKSTSALWLILIGHGTFDGQEAKFNLRGPDLSAGVLAEWLKDFERPLAILNTFSASGPFLSKLSAPGRVVISATRSGSEQNYSRFGKYLSEAILSQEADLDKDGQTSLLEAYLKASRALLEFYKTEGRLATEHPLLDDNGDALGTPADWFRGIRAVKKPKDGSALDGLQAHQMHLVGSADERALSPSAVERRNAIERAIEQLRQQKSGLNEDDYYHRLESLLIDLAQLYHANDSRAGTTPGGNTPSPGPEKGK